MARPSGIAPFVGHLRWQKAAVEFNLWVRVEGRWAYGSPVLDTVAPKLIDKQPQLFPIYIDSTNVVCYKAFFASSDQSMNTVSSSVKVVWQSMRRDIATRI